MRFSLSCQNGISRFGGEENTALPNARQVTDSLNSVGFLKSRGDKIRTCDLLVPNQALYQAEPHPEFQAINLAQRYGYHKANRLR
jgi:hypothetical protein